MASRILSMCRQQDGTASQVGGACSGHEGQLQRLRQRIEGRKQLDACRPCEGMNPYVEEHRNLVASIRRRNAAQRGPPHRREHAHGDHGTRGGLHGQGHHLDAVDGRRSSILPPAVALGPLVVPPVPTPGETTLLSRPSARGGDVRWIVGVRGGRQCGGGSRAPAPRCTPPLGAATARGRPGFRWTSRRTSGCSRATPAPTWSLSCDWMHERGFRSLEDNGMRGRPVEEQERIAPRDATARHADGGVRPEPGHRLRTRSRSPAATRPSANRSCADVRRLDRGGQARQRQVDDRGDGRPRHRSSSSSTRRPTRVEILRPAAATARAARPGDGARAAQPARPSGAASSRAFRRRTRSVVR